MARLNKKILCFIDEHGTAENAGFALGCVMIWARECGKADKAFSDLLPASVNEVHAVDWHKPHLQGILGRFSQTETPQSLLMLNKLTEPIVGERFEIYARTIIETVKIAAKRFRKQNDLGSMISNIEVIIDINEQNSHPDFENLMKEAQQKDGLFRSVNRVVSIDSAASRMLQLADIVAHSRVWINTDDATAKGLKEAYKIEVL